MRQDFNNKIIEYLIRYKPTRIGIFGSFARGENKPASDIDILVVFENDIPDLYKIEQSLKTYLKKHFKREIDICAKKWIKPVFKPLVLNEVIYA